MRPALAVILLLLFPASALAADQTVAVPTVDGAQINIEIYRPDGNAKVPVILTYSPYNTLFEALSTPKGNTAHDGLGDTFVPKGYARAVADVIGTRNSTGCWDYGGAKEQQSGVDIVNWLAKQPWSNGRVAMIGGSYDGTTANMVATRGADVPGLASIVPQSAINHWYGYAYQDGVRYSGNTKNPSDEGVDTPLGFDFGIARTPPTHPTDPAQITDLLTGRYNPCDSADHTAHGYDDTPDYDAFWLSRDYLKDAAKVRVPVLVTHGWQDYNVKQSEGTDFFQALGPRTPFKKLFMFQGQHEGAPSDPYDALLERFFARTLKGVANGIERDPEVMTQGRSAETPDKGFRTETAWPPPTTGGVALQLGRAKDGTGVLATQAGGADKSYSDSGTENEESSMQGLSDTGGHLVYTSAPLTAAVRLAGSALLELRIADSQDHGHLTPTLVDIAPDGSATPISRGFLNLQYRDGLTAAKAVPAAQPISVRARLAPQDQTVAKGHRLGVIVASSNSGWAIPSQPAGYEVTVLSGARSRLILPVVGAKRGGLPGAGGTSAPLPDTTLAAQRAERIGAALRRLTVTARHRNPREVVVSGIAPTGTRVTLRVTRAHHRALRRVVRARRGTFRTTFRIRGRGRLRVRATATVDGRAVHATRTLRAGRR